MSPFLLGKASFWARNFKEPELLPHLQFWTIGHERNMIAFENEEISAHRMKSSFICNFWTWTSVHSVHRYSSLLDLLTWLVVNGGR